MKPGHWVVATAPDLHRATPERQQPVVTDRDRFTTKSEHIFSTYIILHIRTLDWKWLEYGWNMLTTFDNCWILLGKRLPAQSAVKNAGCLSWLQRSVPTRMADRCRRRAAHNQAKGQQWVVLERYNVLHWTWVHFIISQGENMETCFSLFFLVKVAGLRMWHYKNYFWANPWCKALDDDDRNLSPPLSTSFSTLPFRDFSCITKVWNNAHSHVRSKIVCVLSTVYHSIPMYNIDYVRLS